MEEAQAADSSALAVIHIMYKDEHETVTTLSWELSFDNTNTAETFGNSYLKLS